MTELQWFAFVILPLSITVVALVGAFFTNRSLQRRVSGKAHHHTPAE